MKKLILMFMVVMATVFTVSCGDDGNDSNNPNESGGFLNAVKGFTDTVGGEDITFSADGKTMTVKDTADIVIYTFDGDTAHNTQGVYKSNTDPVHYVAMYIKNGKEMYILDAVAAGILDKKDIDWSSPATLLYTLP